MEIKDERILFMKLHEFKEISENNIFEEFFEVNALVYLKNITYKKKQLGATIKL